MEKIKNKKIKKKIKKGKKKKDLLRLWSDYVTR
jgi:hypothetical protein